MTMRVINTPDAIAHKLAQRRRSFRDLAVDDTDDGGSVAAPSDASCSSTPVGSPDKMRLQRPNLSLVVSSPADRPGAGLGRGR